MNLNHFTTQMENNAETIRQLTEGISDEQARWKPDAGSWSILEVINHLDDEEREDFRVRLAWIFDHPNERWPPTDPEGWVIERQYNQRELKPSLANFLHARQESLAWLRTLSSANWQTVYHGTSRQITAGDMFASWLAHDLLHMRQLVELHWAYTTHLLQPYDVGYAGGW